MSVNKHQPHVFVLPEDDANRQLANEFHKQVDWTQYRQMQVLRVAGGWNEVLNLFNSDHVMGMDRWPHRFMVLLIDFDSTQDRLQTAKTRIPQHLTDRVFILGAWSDPEALRQAGLGSYETIGAAMATDCRDETDSIWSHELLRHNANELDRLRQYVRPILFASE
jgi:hypothetical protein